MLPQHQLQQFVRSKSSATGAFRLDPTSCEITDDYGREFRSQRSARKAWGAPNISDDADQVRRAKSPKRRSRQKRSSSARKTKRKQYNFSLRPESSENYRDATFRWNDEKEDHESSFEFEQRTERMIDNLKDRLYALQVQRDKWRERVGRGGPPPTERDLHEAETMVRRYEREMTNIDRLYESNERRRGNGSSVSVTNGPSNQDGKTFPRSHKIHGTVLAAVEKHVGGDERDLLKALRSLSDRLENKDTGSDGSARRRPKQKFTGLLDRNTFSAVLFGASIGLTAAQCETIAKAAATDIEDEDTYDCVDYVEFMDRVFEARELRRSGHAVRNNEVYANRETKTGALLRGMRKSTRRTEESVSVRHAFGSSASTQKEEGSKGRKRWTKSPTIPRPFPGVSRHVKAFEERSRKSRSETHDGEDNDDDDNGDDDADEPFRARPVPPSTFEPLYERIVQEQSARRKEVHEERKMLHDAQSRPFEGIEKREREMRRKRQARVEKLRRSEKEAHLNEERERRRKKRLAAAMRRRRNGLSYEEVVREDEEKRRQRIEERREKLLAESHLPKRMEESAMDSTTKRRSRAPDARRRRPYRALEMPDFAPMHDQWEKSLSEAKQAFDSTKPEPFSFDDPESPRRKNQRARAEARRRERKKRQEREKRRADEAAEKKRAEERKVRATRKLGAPKPTRSSVLRSKLVRQKLKDRQNRKKLEVRRQKKKAEREEEVADALRSQWHAIDHSRKGRFTLRMAERKAGRYRESHSKKKLVSQIEDTRRQIDEKLKDRVPLWMRQSLETKKRQAKLDALEATRDILRGDDDGEGGKRSLADEILTPDEIGDMEMRREAK